MSVALRDWLIFVLMFGSFSLLWCALMIRRMYRRIRELESELEVNAWLLAQTKPPDPEDWWKE
jgi:hypothetical protein